MKLDLVHRSAEFSNEGPEGRGGRRCSRLKGRAVITADCLHFLL